MTDKVTKALAELKYIAQQQYILLGVTDEIKQYKEYDKTVKFNPTYLHYDNVQWIERKVCYINQDEKQTRQCIKILKLAENIIKEKTYTTMDRIMNKSNREYYFVISRTDLDGTTTIELVWRNEKNLIITVSTVSAQAEDTKEQDPKEKK